MKLVTDGRKLATYFPFEMCCDNLSPGNQRWVQGCRSVFQVEDPRDIYVYCSIGMGHASHTSCAVRCPACGEWNYFDMDGYPEFVWKNVLLANKGRKPAPPPHEYRDAMKANKSWKTSDTQPVKLRKAKPRAKV